jgi:hypothetical protein
VTGPIADIQRYLKRETVLCKRFGRDITERVEELGINLTYVHLNLPFSTN